MLYVFKFPDIGEGIHEGKILKWHVKKGQEVMEGDPVVNVETDKVVTDIPIPKDGVIKNTYGKEGEVINVGDALVEMEVEGEEAEEEAEVKAPPKEGREAEGEPASRTEVAKAKTKTKKIEEKGFGVVGQIEEADTDAFLPATGEGMEAQAAVAAEKEPGRKALATPVARKMAMDLGIDINTVRGTGPAGRVMKEDIKKAFDEKQAGPKVARKPGKIEIPAEAEDMVEVEELTQIRKTIINRMVQSKFTAPHATAFEEVEVSRLVELRKEKKEELAEQGVKLSYMPFIIKAVSLALRRHKSLNCKLDMENNRVIYQKFYNIGFATDTPEGLMVPVIKNADRKSIIEIAESIKDLSDRARERKIQLDELKGGTFSITNYGSIAGTYGVPVINYPEVAILGVGRIVQRPVVKGGEIVPGNVLPLSMSFDHRIVDGADAARFIKDLMAMLADPLTMLMM
ncbi:MAG TPA: 2-oxo acid dehydrogenase subunit E2 [candidate division Zixibacteria bacterium]|nr:2-oxo acid dehydrogenase subunit E2 [candidate division Zixibacteria bacterium]HER00188.1 2-oxo acid dehydrogenase subunit E2 [candidate division Zixibacteria bacterium]